ncbi:hypothetical protein ACSMXM_09630 [Pacificimonas sp. ICDLI1SI03]
MSERTELKSRLRMVEVVLRWAWDPIGVRGIGEAADEYDSYALPVLGILERSAPDEQVANFLTSVETERMGIEPDTSKNADLAVMLRELHAIYRMS